MKQSVLAGYEPALVWAYFEEICAIPHVSGEEKALADYVEAFARTRNLAVYRDGVHNVFVRLPASAGRETEAAILLQGHLDMVGEKESDSTHDFSNDGLALRVEDGFVRATGTTLGGDDGIAVAMMLAVLDCPPATHPALECLFTVSEETGMNGAWAFDPEAAATAGVPVTARTMVNLDSESQGVITAGCAGGMRTDLTLPLSTEPVPAGHTALTLTLGGFSGGHSGVEIHEGHTNAIKALARMLRGLPADRQADLRLVTLSGGGKDNAIPRDATATFTLPVTAAESVTAALLHEADLLRAEPHRIAADRGFICTVTAAPVPTCRFTAQSHAAALSLVNAARDGVLAMHAYMKGLVAYSRNLGIVRTVTDGEGAARSLELTLSTRSATGRYLDEAEREMDDLVALYPGATATHRSRYPGWDYAPTSPLRDQWSKICAESWGYTPRVEVIHAGLECGILCHKLPGLDIVSVGPDMADIHTPGERLSIASVAEVYRVLCRVITDGV